MSANSGLTVSPNVTAAYAEAVNSDTRFILISIQGELLELGKAVPPSASTLQEDLALLPDLLEDKVPSYILARLDDEDRSWLFISYVPENATVRHKMLYASSRSALTKTLGDRKIKDNLFATTKADLTPEAYAAHIRSTTAPKPMSAREQEMEAVRAAERSSGVISSSARKTSHLAGSSVGCAWSQEVANAVSSLAVGSSETGNLVVISIDLQTETLVLVDHKSSTLEDLPNELPASDPSYSFFAWDHDVDGAPKRDIIFVYACPTTSPIKSRMVYSSGVTGAVFTASQDHRVVVSKRIETSDPSDVDVSWIKRELEPTLDTTGTAPVIGDEKKPFARPRGPAKKR